MTSYTHQMPNLWTRTVQDTRLLTFISAKTHLTRMYAETFQYSKRSFYSSFLFKLFDIAVYNREVKSTSNTLQGFDIEISVGAG